MAAPAVVLPPTPVLPGVTVEASGAKPGDPAAFEMGGFRLGMSADAVLAAVKAHEMTVVGRQLSVDFETNVRNAINIRTGSGLPETHRPVLSQLSVNDTTGDRYMLGFLAWPDGAHLYQIEYQGPRGTSAAEWQRLLTERFGRPNEGSVGDTNYNARWCGHSAPRCAVSTGATATAAIGKDGGWVNINAPQGISGRVGQLIMQAVDASVPTHRPSF